MKLLRSILYTAVLLGCFGSTKAQQASSFTQYHNNQVPFNAAYSLLEKAGSVNLNARRQWVGIEGAPSVLQLNGTLPLARISAATGLSLTYDKFNVEKLAEVSAFLAKAVQLSQNNYLSVAFSAGFRNYNASYSQLDATDPSFMNDIRETVGTLGLGMMFYSPEKYYIGASLPRLSIRSLGTASAEQARNYSNTYYFSGAYLFTLNPDVKLKPAAMVAYSRTVDTRADVSATVYLKDKFGLGVNYSTTSEVSGMVSVSFSSSIRLGYSYQTGIGNQNLGGISHGSHEITVGFRFGELLSPKLL